MRYDIQVLIEHIRKQKNTEQKNIEQKNIIILGHIIFRRFMYTLDWVEEVKLRYTSSESSIFILHGNIRDLYPWMDEDGNLCF